MSQLPKWPGPRFTNDASQDVFDKAQPRERVAIAILFAEHAAAEAECHAFGEQVARACNCTLIKGPLKTLERANQKVVRDYQGKGDWSQVKDLVRMTILAPRAGELAGVARKIDAMATAPWCIIKDGEAKADEDRCGYSGLNYVLQKNRAGSVGATKLGQPDRSPAPKTVWQSGVEKVISNAQWAKTVRMEIQANTPNMIYGKEAAEDFLNMLGPNLGPKQLEKMKQASKIVGGLGHVFYEITQKPPSNVIKETAMNLSKRYYEYLRAPHKCSQADFRTLCLELEEFVGKKEVSPFFHKHPVRSIALIPLSSPAKVGPSGKVPIPGAFLRGR